MAIRFRVPRNAMLVRFLMHPVGKLFVVLALLCGAVGLGTFTYYYTKYARLIDEKLARGPYETTSMIFAAPKVVWLGEEITPEEIAAQLRRSGYTESSTNPLGWYHLRENAIEIFPGRDSYFDPEPGVIKFAGGRVVEIVSLRDNTARTQYLLEPELITNLFNRNREKRRPVRFEDIPKVLVDAVIAAEDKRFFQHSGFDPLRIVKAAYVDLKERRMEQGASTLSMQLARSLWLDTRKTWRRKAAEVLITLHLEQKLTKEQIFEYYANHVDLGRRGSFAIRGFGEAARAYFGKDLRELTLPEAATLAGLIQRPSYTNPVRWPERARARRNVVLALMRENGFITEEQYAAAVTAPLTVVKGGGESSDAPYFVDLVNDELQERFQDHDFQGSSYRIYTTLDLNLQRAAAEAVRLGLEEVDQQIERRWRGRKGPHPQAQVALVALDPHTGEVKALIGGRDYGQSQLNRVLARRQPGSAFKPFVYAAALNTALEGRSEYLTPVSTVPDVPTTFWFDDKPYTPANYKNEYHGTVTLREALVKSLNVPTVKVAEIVGYDAVVDLAVRCGLNMRIKATPAVALGAYEVTPLEVAGAYTVFANQGVYVAPNWLKLVRDQSGRILYQYKPVERTALDPRVAYMMVNLMEDVLRRGTGAGVRARGFWQPAAGKTGTSHDGWFVGFTSKLLCAVWVGFDDNRELGLEGARSALPIWAEFMKRAHQLREYRSVAPFEPPDGVVTVDVDPLSGGLATPACPRVQPEVFIAGTQPVEVCRLHGAGQALATHVTGWESASPEPAATPQVAAAPPAVAAQAATRAPAVQTPAASGRPALADKRAGAKPKKGWFRRLLDVFK
ncbi:MAG TPA: PBP1A family penicillin-binding protein [Bryobacteraceae bacterium]|nr:PBP1A family penicillin-binding protein [Bryobacteraceae bacterium]